MKPNGFFAFALAAGIVLWAVTRDHAANPPAGGASATSPTRVAVIDIVRVFNEFDQTKVLNQKMSALENDLTNQDQKKNQELETQKAALKAYAPSSAEYKKQNDELKRMMVEYQIWKLSKQDEVAQAHLDWINKTYKKVEDQVGATAKAKNFQLVITRQELDTSITDSKVMLKQIIERKVIYSDASIDLTDEVLSSLNAQFSKDGGAKSITIGAQ